MGVAYPYRIECWKRAHFKLLTYSLQTFSDVPSHGPLFRWTELPSFGMKFFVLIVKSIRMNLQIILVLSRPGGKFLEGLELLQ
jgi:hypothetical protein